MGYKNIQIKVPTEYSEQNILNAIKKKLGTFDFTFVVDKKSLDVRKKNNPHWVINLIVSSNQFGGYEYCGHDTLNIEYKKRGKNIVVVGSGPAGFFAAHVLQMSGFNVTIIERGSDVKRRNDAINALEKNGHFSAKNNYAFGEGGAGTFSDGKLTSRSKRISIERHFILSEYVKAGAPKEILYLAHPHLGTDKLKTIIMHLRKNFEENGGKFIFDTMLKEIIVKNGCVKSIISDNSNIDIDHLILATGHSAYDTYRMLIQKGVIFRTKNFAIGHRIEHQQSLINYAQWGKEKLQGVKAAEYRLATKTASGLPVYTFCMCPGGRVVPAAAYDKKSVVNGMSYYARDSLFANAGCVAGVHPDMLLGHKCSPLEILDWMDKLEESFYSFSSGLVIPAVNAVDYVNNCESKDVSNSSYSLGLKAGPLQTMVPYQISSAIAEAIKIFSRKLRGFENGQLMGLESKTSSPLQVMREKNSRCCGFDNLYFVGEGAGFSGGIISSAADGVKCAMALTTEF